MHVNFKSHWLLYFISYLPIYKLLKIFYILQLFYWVLCGPQLCKSSHRKAATVSLFTRVYGTMEGDWQMLIYFLAIKHLFIWSFEHLSDPLLFVNFFPAQCQSAIYFIGESKAIWNFQQSELLWLEEEPKRVSDIQWHIFHWRILN